MSPDDVDKMMKQMLLKDLRIQCRARGLSPAGGKEQLADRLKENMLATNDLCAGAARGRGPPEHAAAHARAGVAAAWPRGGLQAVAAGGCCVPRPGALDPPCPAPQRCPPSQACAR